MSSIRNTPAETAEALLDAARESILAIGVRRTTMTEVAKRAGVSRMTAYRAYPDVRSLVADLLTRELGALLRGIGAPPGGAMPARKQLVDAAVAVAEQLPHHVLFRRIVDVDAELLLPYVVERLGQTQLRAIDVVEHLLREGARDGSIRPTRGHGRVAAAHCILLVVQSFVLSAEVVGERTGRAALSRELRRLLDGYLCPDRP